MLSLLLSSSMAATPVPPLYSCTGEEVDPTAVGSGTATDPWLLCTATQLSRLGEEPTGHFQLIADIDLEGWDWESLTPCAIFPTVGGFEGHLDGQDHTLFNLWSDGGGLFACVHGGTVEGLELIDATVEGDGYATGGLVDFADSATLLDIYLRAETESEHSATGGAVGVAYDTQLARVGVDGRVTGTDNVGGLVGIAVRTGLTDCYTQATVSGDRNLGGFLGNASGIGEPVDILRCYSNANVWDFSTYEEPAAGLAIGLSTGTVRFGDTSGETLGAVVLRQYLDRPVIGREYGGSTISGPVVPVFSNLLLFPSTFLRAGWDLETVWNPPVPYWEPPTLR